MEYFNTFGEIFGPVVPKIGSIRFITNPEYNVALYEDTQQILTEMNPKISCSHKTTTDFHDRFWIADEKKGLFIGTSLNGIGRNMRYPIS